MRFSPVQLLRPNVVQHGETNHLSIIPNPDYLDMDKAGYELLFIPNPAFVNRNNPE